MRTIVKGKNVEVPDRVREYAERKLQRLGRLLDDRTDAIVELSNEMHRSASDAHIAEVTLVIDGRDAAQPRGRRSATRPRSTRSSTRSSARRSTTSRSPALRARPEQEKRILRTPRRRDVGCRRPSGASSRRSASRIEPMFEEDAIAAMEELGHQFFVFVNAETERVAILYARRDGDFGLIEPIVGGEYTQGPRRATAAAAGPDALRRAVVTIRAGTRRPRGSPGPHRPCRAGSSRHPGGTAPAAG